MENEVITLQNYDEYKDIVKEIIEVSEAAISNFLNLGRLFKKVKERKLYLLEEYNSVYEFAEDKFGYKETSVKNFINVFNKYADDPDELDSECDIKEGFENYSFTSLVELLPVSNEEIQANYSPDMKVKEIRETKIVSQLTEELKKRIERYNHIIDILKKEVDSFHKELGKEFVKFRKIDNKKTIEDFELRSCFEYSWKTFYIDSSMTNVLRLDYKECEELLDEEIIQNFNVFLKKVKSLYEENVKDAEKKKEKQELEKQKKQLPYEDVSFSSLVYYGAEDRLLFSMIVYLEYVILSSEKSIYSQKLIRYKDKLLYEHEIIYKDLSIGWFGYNRETKETYFKFKLIKEDIIENNGKEYKYFYWTIDSDSKRCDLFTIETLSKINFYYNKLAKEKELDEGEKDNGSSL